MRADRLVAVLLFMQARGRVTAADVATELEISIRTARRDLEALAIAGIPVYSQAGRNGGWSLIGGARTDLSGLTADEARTLFLVAGPSSAATPAAKAALRKLVQALPATFRADAERAANAVVLDPVSWGERAPDRPPYLDTLQQAVLDGVQVRLGYNDRSRQTTERVVHPLGLVSKGSTWYLIGNTPAGLRTFRVWRVASVEVLDIPAERPADFDLATAWQAVVDHMDGQRTMQQVHAAAEPWLLRELRGHFGSRLSIGEGRDDGRIDVWLGFHADQPPAGEIAGYVYGLEVLHPPAVRDALATVGLALQRRYGPGDPAATGRRPTPQPV